VITRGRSWRPPDIRGRAEDSEQGSSDKSQDQAASQQRQDNAFLAKGAAQPQASPLPPKGALLPVVSLHVTIELPRIIGDLDVDRWQASVVPFRFAAWVHAYLSSGANVYFQYGPVMPVPVLPVTPNRAQIGGRTC